MRTDHDSFCTHLFSPSFLVWRSNPSHLDVQLFDVFYFNPLTPLTPPAHLYRFSFSSSNQKIKQVLLFRSFLVVTFSIAEPLRSPKFASQPILLCFDTMVARTLPIDLPASERIRIAPIPPSPSSFLLETSRPSQVYFCSLSSLLKGEAPTLLPIENRRLDDLIGKVTIDSIGDPVYLSDPKEKPIAKSGRVFAAGYHDKAIDWSYEIRKLLCPAQGFFSSPP